MAWRRWSVWGGVALLLIAALVWAYAPRPVEVELAPVTRGPMEVTVVEPGQTRVKVTRRVTAPLNGELERLRLDPGDEVERGQVIARLLPLASPLLDPNARAQAEANVAAAEAEVRQAQATVARARQASRLAARNRQRVEILRRGGGAAAAEVDQVEAEAKTAADAERVAAAGVRVAEARLNAARAALGNGAETAGAVEVVAPVSGRVLRLGPQLEGAVAAGTALMELGSLEAMEVYVDLLTPDAVRVAQGAALSLQRWGGAQPLKATVTRVEPGGFTRVSALGVEEQRTWVVGRLDSPLEERPRLGDAFRVEVHVPLWRSPDALQVPEGALFRRSGGWEVLVADGSRLAGRQIRIGERNGSVAEVLEGLEAGEQVVVHPGERARAGVRYRVLEAR